MDPDPRPPAARPTGIADDLPVRGADLVDQLVELLRDRTVRPLTLATRAIVYGLIVFAASLVVVVLVSIALIRFLTVYFFEGRVWISQLVVGALFVVAGLVAWRLRRDPNAESQRPA
jgi:hypothetical protein